MATFLWRYDDEPEPASEDTAFSDVPAGKFYSRAVAWLAEKEITTGKTATTFAPDDPVTRGEMATFLWRYSGEPEPASLDTPFTDVPAGKFYSKAVAWLVEKKITTGKTATMFAPDDPVTRGEMATFLWRLAGEPAV
jgi:predicted enzyme related to lactoylglutathione lyase